MRLPSITQAVSVNEGNSPIILTQPHSGLFVPDQIWESLNSVGQELADTDWRIPELYTGLLGDATVVKAEFNRYVVDVNRASDNQPLYKSENTTTLVPITDFRGRSIWREVPSEDDVHQRTTRFHQPYHQALRQQIERLQKIHKHVLVYDCHSICSELPFLFQGRLPDLNIGSNSGTSCDQSLLLATKTICEKHPNYSHVFDQRFKGGWTTRHYGQPHSGVHVIQMELSQRLYLVNEQAPFEYCPQKANLLRNFLRDVLNELEHVLVRLN